ncbi:hypothetical protein D9M68_791210 [compost metagenome]
MQFAGCRMAARSRPEVLQALGRTMREPVRNARAPVAQPQPSLHMCRVHQHQARVRVLQHIGLIVIAAHGVKRYRAQAIDVARHHDKKGFGAVAGQLRDGIARGQVELAKKRDCLAHAFAQRVVTDVAPGVGECDLLRVAVHGTDQHVGERASAEE